MGLELHQVRKDGHRVIEGCGTVAPLLTPDGQHETSSDDTQEVVSECKPWHHRWVTKTNRYDQSYRECRRCKRIET